MVEVGDLALAQRVNASGYLERKGRRVLRMEEEGGARPGVIVA